ncbi:hypothetical protein PFICI_09265 [Pestalotiopsis fici W106-1]|uniref:FAD dependent oxidoreductase domain-containing protein n=1 Tax=Pestalotiopsis fici (strain W106-1 / CGMCC3.15140) TaxID=1229662 RepID=W3X213_PESFW|nr:uncharacterized protein PFICI_09265 [Pestalotiopsis fici W106-1]ETS79412.1 hypothetical protein PFICI_09265 [Pestalotiopsis fici W106-1]
MGVVQSKLKTLSLAIKALLMANKQIEELLERVQQPPGLPVPNPSPSYWLEDPPHPELVDTQSPGLPERADIVIVGSGITGAAVVRSVLQASSGAAKGGKPRVVVLEARTLCSGATGRNGGHIKSSPHELFARLKGNFGPERAAAVTRFQLAHVKILTELCQSEGWDVAECREVETVDLYLDPEDRDKVFEEVRELRKWIPELDIETYDAASAQKKFDVNKFVVGAISYTAGALWPYRFVSSVWRDLLAQFGENLSIETRTAVTDIQVGDTENTAYRVVTDRGIIECNHVVHATNGFAGQFVPGLRGKLSSLLAHMSAQRPGKQFPDYGGSRSWSVIYAKSAFDYITQRPTVNGVPGDIMLGGGFDRSRDQGLSVIGRYDDSSEAIDALTVNHIGNIFPTIFSPQWGDDQEGGRIKKYWTGVVALTGDLLPFVGRLDPKLTGRRPRQVKKSSGVDAGEWIAAGYCGDGMVWAWLSGTALGAMITGREKDKSPATPGHPGGRLEDWFPHELKPSSKRVDKADIANLMELMF